jgi:signal transduction histidine kinase
MARLRNGLIRALRADWKGDAQDLAATLMALNKLIDLDLAIISDAYETEHAERQKETERRQIEEMLQREQELSSGLLMHAHAAVLVVDQRACIVRSNPIAESFAAGRPGDALEGLEWMGLFLSSDDAERVRASLLEPTAGGQPQPVTASSVIETPQGRRQVHWSAVGLSDARGDRFAGLVLGHDVTDLYEAQRRALQAERLAAIGQMATGLAHESRSALQRIGASAEMLELELEQNPAALELLARIQQSKSHLHQLLEEVRSYAAPIVLDRSPLRITEPWREAWELLSAERKGRTARLGEHLRARNLLVDADRFRLVQVFRNLFDNSLAAASDPVAIDVTCEPAELRGRPALRIRVRDNGRGLSSEERRRLFEPFYTTKPTGTGLGTAIAQRLVEAHGGTIEVGDSSPSGTEIVLTLLTA